jgi:hypothetical protein
MLKSIDMDSTRHKPYRTAEVHEYVHLIINEVAPEYDPDFGYMYDIASSEISFVRNLPSMQFPFTHEDYIANDSVIKSADALGLDREKFWYAMLCVYHLAEEYCKNAHPVLESSVERFRRIEEIIRGKDAYIIAKCDGRKKELIEDHQTLRLIADTIDRICRVQEWRNDPAFTGKPVLLGEKMERSASSRIAFAANRYSRLFKVLNIVGKRSKEISVNKLFFISQVLHLTKIAVNDSFLVSDEALRGVLNKYGDEDFSDTFSGFYSL